MTGSIFSSIEVATLDLIHWLVLSSSRRKRGIIILASWKDHYIKVGENMVQYPSNYIRDFGTNKNY